ncbi:cation diffusion facilitator family transporter [Alkalibacillus silvisoli]|uniref:Cation diffusion facilitator family transporter n=1 Tax=Alkalibacillus silvisoli TaxID=392823 RepID=A0ABN0ZR28_9BACI
MTKHLVEQRYIKWSIYAITVFAVISFVLGLLLQSQVILFDGLYSIISVFLSFFALVAFKFMNKSDSHRFPFGKDVIEPMVIIVKYFAIIVLISGSIIAAVIALFQGGRPVSIGAGLAYSTFSSIFCYIVYKFLSTKGREIKSNLLRVEANEWYLDTLVSFGVLIGFMIGFVLQFIPMLEPYIVYVDPVLMIVISLYFLKWPIIEIRQSMYEILDMRPLDGKPEFVEEKVDQIRELNGIEESYVRVSKVGKTLWVDVNFLVQQQGVVDTIDEQDRIRNEIYQKITELEVEKKWLTVAFTKERDWAV